MIGVGEGLKEKAYMTLTAILIYLDMKRFLGQDVSSFIIKEVLKELGGVGVTLLLLKKLIV